ncbi:MAG: RIP metalloprotease RseP [Acidimicrobiia bacterium]|nr:RIP metalloprotease RseP [Acidimicrobiia bacterium]MDX2467733.1 RIP metalloprotease RseP [Acidimicrobiia bacterium]
MGPIVVIVGMLLMVVIHEAGHFVMAKFFDMKATEAFFGFGPRLWSMTRGETEYGVKAIPLGGYVRIVGMNPFEEVAPEEEHRTYRGKPFWQKAIVVLAGIFSHFVMAFILFFIVAVTWNSFEPSTSVDSASEVLITTSGAAEPVSLVLEDGDSVVSVDGVPLAELATTTNKAPNQLVTVVVDSGGTEVTVETNDNVVATPALVIGIQQGDRLVAVDGIEIQTWDQFVELAHARPAELAEVQYERDGEIVTTEVVFAERQLDGETIGFLGVGPAGEEIDIGPIKGVTTAFGLIGETFVLSIQGLFEMVRQTPKLVGAAFGQDAAVLQEARPVSVIGLVRVATGLEFALFLMAYVNVFVGTLNLIPLYPLDGGHFAVALYEKIRGREADVRRLLPIAAAVFIFIVAIGVLGIYFDIVDPLPVAR